MNPDQWKHIDELAQAALEFSPEERAAFLHKVCRGDDRLRQEVESLIVYQLDARSFLERPAIQDAAGLLVKDETESRAGQSIAHYKIEKQLGSGGMGEVYLASDTRTDRPVALKLLPRSLIGDEASVRRFQQEARAVLTLNHPNIVTIYEIGDAENNYFIAGELIQGETLRERLARQPLKPGEALDVAIQVAAALTAAHEAGVVHRDIKPDNIMRRPDGHVKVLDFGIAKFTGPATPANLEVATKPLVRTNPGAVMGTVLYMSPEQAQGGEIDARTDVWSLGCVLFEMVTRHVPFELPAGATPSHAIVAILEKEPLSIRRYVPDAAPDLEHVVEEALTRDRAERPTAKQMLASLKKVKHRLETTYEFERSVAPDLPAAVATVSNASLSTISTAPGTEYKSTRRRMTRLIALAGAAVVLAAVAFGIYKYFAPHSSNR